MELGNPCIMGFLRWTTGTKKMKRSSAYPVLFGQAVRGAHQIVLQHGSNACINDGTIRECEVIATKLLAHMPPEGHELPHVS